MVRVVAISTLLPLLVSCSPAETTSPPVTAEPSRGPRRVDRSATQAAFAAISLSGCEALQGPRGRGHIKVTFASEGRVINTEIDEGGYAGTEAGDCIESAFRTLEIPAWDGEPVTIGKSFQLK